MCIVYDVIDCYAKFLSCRARLSLKKNLTDRNPTKHIYCELYTIEFIYIYCELYTIEFIYINLNSRERLMENIRRQRYTRILYSYISIQSINHIPTLYTPVHITRTWYKYQEKRKDTNSQSKHNFIRVQTSHMFRLYNRNR